MGDPTVVGRDAIFRAFLNRHPTTEERQRLDHMAVLMGLDHDDPHWYVIIVQEMYDDRLKNRLAEVDRVAEGAADKALAKIAEAVVEKAEELAAKKNQSVAWQSWGLMMTPLVLFGAAVFNAGYMMGSGNPPFWIRAERTGLVQVLGWFLNVPSGWILLLGSAPFLFKIYIDCSREIFNRERFGEIIHFQKKFLLYAKAAASLLALAFIGLIVLYFTGITAFIQGLYF